MKSWVSVCTGTYRNVPKVEVGMHQMHADMSLAHGNVQDGVVPGIQLTHACVIMKMTTDVGHDMHMCDHEDH